MPNNEKKEQAALAIGFLLIIFVITITIIRNNPFMEEKNIYKDNRKQAGKTEQNQSSEKKISAKDLQNKILHETSNPSFILLDVRSFKDYSKEHIVDVVNIPIEDFSISEIDTHKQIIIIGENDTDTNVSQTVNKMKEGNVENYLVLEGGMEGWAKAAGPTVTYGIPSSFVDQSKVSYVEPEKLKEALDKNVPTYIVDVRENDEYQKGHISGAKNIPFLELEKRRREVTEKKVIVVGSTELEEFQAAVQLNDMLLVSSYVLKGSMTKWQEKGFPLVK
jgi:rhodanese-related sulfurtransferase